MARASKPTFTRRDVLRWSAAGALTSVSTLGYGDLSTNMIGVETFDLQLPRWDADGFRVAVISDLHMGNRRQFRNAIQAVRLAKEQKPDVILVPGDFVEYSDSMRLDYVRRFVQRLGDGPIPVFATLGNHDYWTRRPQDIIRQFDSSPVRLLRNEVADVQGVSIAGIDDAIARRHRPDSLSKGRHSRSLLAMLHEPDYVREMPKHVSLQVSGHSHGGQICLPFGVSLHTPAGARDYIDGYYPNAPIPLFVSRGIGTTGPPYRLFCRPQVAVLTLKAA